MADNGHNTDHELTEAAALKIVRTGEGTPMEIALAYGRLGLRVHPAIPSAKLLKVPYIAGWQQKATADPAQIRVWWKKYPQALIATPSDDYWLLDCDNPKKNAQAKDGIGNAERLFGPLEDLSQIRFFSPSDGINVLFRRRPDDHPITASSLIAPGIDTRGLRQDDDLPGGQFILPGSKRTDGKSWRWCDADEDLDPRQASFAPEAVVREASLTKHARDLMAASPELAAAIADAPPADIPRLLSEREAIHHPKPGEPQPEPTGTETKRRRAIALAGIAGDAGKLAAMPADSKRDDAVYARACRWAGHIGAGVINRDELVDPLLQASSVNGLIKKNTRKGVLRTINNAIKKYENDALEPLKHRENGEREQSERKNPRQKAKAHTNGSGNGVTPPRDPPSRGKPQPEPKPGPATNPANNHPEPCAPNEDAIAEAYAERYRDELRYCHDWGAWLKWDGSRWGKERRQLAFHYARHLARYANADEKPTPARASTAAGVERFARADPRLSTLDEDWDHDPWLLAAPDGTVDLRTGKLRAASRDDFITKRTAVTPAAPGTPTPIWNAFLNAATQNNDELIAYLQRVSGYALTGDVSEHALFFLYGDGGNGKGTFLNTLQAILGDHVTVAAMDTFAASRGSSHPTDLALLRGARLVTAQETEEGRAWNEVRIKALTGGDPLSARFMRQDFFTFQPTFKLIFSGNHRPSLRSVDGATRRRFNMIPFTHKPDKPDRHLAEKLKAEWPGILRWAIDGCLAWQKQTLDPPEIVRNATEAYFDEQDLFTQWIAECCDIGPMKSDTRAALYGSWKAWCERNGDQPGGVKTFSQALVRVGFDKVKNTPGQNGKRGFKGITVRSADTSSWQERHK
jgi:P4 family phage/plasmid primase-like protien